MSSAAMQAAAKRPAVMSAQLAEELPDVFDEQVGGLQCGEVAATAEFERSRSASFSPPTSSGWT
ncbi:hypothetical protein ACIQC5_04990 [Paenarthrobacter sp. NPDC092416]|uniref:hypothetical protein n=1 Tax=Paenarthrobacter sp. NPDC092416 TaxID=3364386 RepID=UPI00381F5009